MQSSSSFDSTSSSAVSSVLSSNVPSQVSSSEQKKIEDKSLQLLEEGKRYRDAGNYSAAVTVYKKAAELGCSEADYELGELYFTGRYDDKDSPADNQKAFEHFKKAADKGNKPSWQRVAYFYDLGAPLLGKTADLKQAVSYYEKSYDPETVNLESLLRLVQVYELGGEGLEKDPDQSHAMFNKLINTVKSDAQNLLPKLIKLTRDSHYWSCPFINKDLVLILSLYTEILKCKTHWKETEDDIHIDFEDIAKDKSNIERLLDYKEANQLYSEGKYDAALKKYEKVLEEYEAEIQVEQKNVSSLFTPQKNSFPKDSEESEREKVNLIYSKAESQQECWPLIALGRIHQLKNEFLQASTAFRIATKIKFEEAHPFLINEKLYNNIDSGAWYHAAMAIPSENLDSKQYEGIKENFNKLLLAEETKIELLYLESMFDDEAAEICDRLTPENQEKFCASLKEKKISYTVSTIAETKEELTKAGSTTDLYPNAVRLFDMGDYLNARNCFSEALKTKLEIPRQFFIPLTQLAYISAIGKHHPLFLQTKNPPFNDNTDVEQGILLLRELAFTYQYKEAKKHILRVYKRGERRYNIGFYAALAAEAARKSAILQDFVKHHRNSFSSLVKTEGKEFWVEIKKSLNTSNSESQQIINEIDGILGIENNATAFTPHKTRTASPRNAALSRSNSKPKDTDSKRNEGMLEALKQSAEKPPSLSSLLTIHKLEIDSSRKLKVNSPEKLLSLKKAVNTSPFKSPEPKSWVNEIKSPENKISDNDQLRKTLFTPDSGKPKGSSMVIEEFPLLSAQEERVRAKDEDPTSSGSSPLSSGRTSPNDSGDELPLSLPPQIQDEGKGSAPEERKNSPAASPVAKKVSDTPQAQLPQNTSPQRNDESLENSNPNNNNPLNFAVFSPGLLRPRDESITPSTPPKNRFTAVSDQLVDPQATPSNTVGELKYLIEDRNKPEDAQTSAGTSSAIPFSPLKSATKPQQGKGATLSPIDENASPRSLNFNDSSQSNIATQNQDEEKPQETSSLSSSAENPINEVERSSQEVSETKPSLENAVDPTEKPEASGNVKSPSSRSRSWSFKGAFIGLAIGLAAVAIVAAITFIFPAAIPAILGNFLNSYGLLGWLIVGGGSVLLGAVTGVVTGAVVDYSSRKKAVIENHNDKKKPLDQKHTTDISTTARSLKELKIPPSSALSISVSDDSGKKIEATVTSNTSNPTLKNFNTTTLTPHKRGN